MTDNQSITSNESYNQPTTSSENADSRRSTTQDDISLESMSAMIAAAIEMSSKGRGASSLSLGHASIIPSSSSTTTTTAQINRSRSTSVRSFFTGSSRQSAPSQSKTKTTTNNIEKTTSMTARPKRSSSMSSQHSLPTPRRSSSASTHRYPARFSWLINLPSSSSTTTPTQETSKNINDAIVEEPRPSEEDIDDGKRELMYRGIRVKEIKTTLKTMVVPHEVERPMPNVKIERPSFARINY